MKTTSVESVSTGVLDKNKEHYLRSRDKAKKSNDELRHVQLHMLKYEKKPEEYQSIVSNLRNTMTSCRVHCYMYLAWHNM